MSILAIKDTYHYGDRRCHSSHVVIQLHYLLDTRLGRSKEIEKIIHNIMLCLTAGKVDSNFLTLLFGGILFPEPPHLVQTQDFLKPRPKRARGSI